jgi:vacuolar-type H+-ATPase subunit E/Vma4
MAIEDILRALDEQAQADCDAVLLEAKEHAKLILDDAEHEAERIHENFARQVERIAKADAAKQVNAARLEAKMEVSSARGDGVLSVFDAAGDKLSSLRAASYDRLFDALAAEAVEGLSGDVEIHVAQADTDRATRAAAASGLAASVAGDLETAGGLVVEAYGGRVIRRNTLEDRLDRVSQIVQADVARVLFS